MDIVIFKGLTTEGVITSIEENSKKYHEGFYADMNNPPERKLVKESASEIGSIIKDIKASGVKIRKAKIAEVNKEEKAIIERLEAANLPFTKLIDDYTVERKKVLDAEKAKNEAIALAEQIEHDHEFALLMDAQVMAEKAIAVQAQIDRDAEIAKQAVINEQEKQARIKQQEIDDAAQLAVNIKYDEEKRLADIEHVRKINKTILASMMSCGLPESESKEFIKIVAQKQLKEMTINY